MKAIMDRLIERLGPHVLDCTVSAIGGTLFVTCGSDFSMRYAMNAIGDSFEGVTVVVEQS